MIGSCNLQGQLQIGSISFSRFCERSLRPARLFCLSWLFLKPPGCHSRFVPPLAPASHLTIHPWSAACSPAPPILHPFVTPPHLAFFECCEQSCFPAPSLPPPRWPLLMKLRSARGHFSLYQYSMPITRVRLLTLTQGTMSHRLALALLRSRTRAHTYTHKCAAIAGAQFV